jgi:hypothetical protein
VVVALLIFFAVISTGVKRLLGVFRHQRQRLRGPGGTIEANKAAVVVEPVVTTMQAT